RLGRDGDAGDGLAVSLLDVVFQRHRRRPDVGAQAHGVLGASPAQFRQREAVTDAANQVAAGRLDALLVLEEAQTILDDLERQAEEPRQVEAEQAAARLQRPQQQVVEKAQGETRLLQGLRSARGFRQYAGIPFHHTWFHDTSSTVVSLVSGEW